MTWAYRIAKKKDSNGDTRYSLVEAFMNDEGEIWGYTNHVDILRHIQYDDYEGDAELVKELFSVLNLVMGDALKDIIDEDNFIAASTGFEEELEAIKNDQQAS